MLLLIALAAFAATCLGGLFALHLKDRLHLVLGFSAGAVIGVAFFDLLPAAFTLPGADSPYTATLVGIGFGLYLILDRVIVLHHHHEDHNDDYESHRASLGAGSLSFHSFLDGLGIGLAFKVSPALGFIVTAAVLAHDFSDGINTVSMVLKNHGGRTLAAMWLLIDALAPVLGITATLFITVSEGQLSALLALFAGFFIYIGASDLLPESHHAHPVRWTTGATLLGMFVIFIAVHYAG